MLVKVCGMREPENIQKLDGLPVDFVGLIFYEGSPRFVHSPLDITAFPERAKRVGVFVNASLEEIKNATFNYGLSVLQLHGQESPSIIREIREVLPGMNIFKVFSVKEKLPAFAEYEELCDAFLFDTAGKSAGGNGVQFDWKILDEYDGQTPFFLSGGIAPESLSAILNFEHPKWIGIDLNSKFERSPALKDIPVLKEFLKKINEN